MIKIGCVVTAALVLVLAGCASDSVNLPEANEYGPDPKLVTPTSSALPTVAIAKAVGWPEGGAPTVGKALQDPENPIVVTRFAEGLDHPRWLLVLPNNDVLVAETNKPASKGGFSGIKGWVAGLMMRYGGGGGASANRITLLRDTNDDGVADLQVVLLRDLNSPFGMAYANGRLYVANTDAVLTVPYTLGSLEIQDSPTVLAPLPAGDLNHHWTKGLVISPNEETLYVSVGSNSNIGENGMIAEHQRAAILAINAETGAAQIFASGLRNPVGMAFEPTTGKLWTVVNERDELGDQLVPDYLTSVAQGEFFGWPYSYWGSVVDERVTPQRPELVAAARAPDYALGAHTASLGLVFYPHSESINQGESQNREAASSAAILSSPSPAGLTILSGMALIGQHGSWNRSIPSGYKIIGVPFEGGQPAGSATTVLEGFLSAEGQAYGRPVGVVVNAAGGVLVADDVGGVIWQFSR